MECKHCGAQVGEEYRLCPYCRSELDYPKQNVVINNYYSTQQPGVNRYPSRQPPNYQYQQNNPQAYTPPRQQYTPPTPQPQPAPPKKNNSQKSWDITLVLCLFLGFLGAHHFYAGKNTTGLIYLCTFGLFGLGWFWDIIMILAGCFKDSHGKPIRHSS